MLACSILLVLVACGPAPVVPTPLPTAIPPLGLTGESWAVSFQHEFPAGAFGLGEHRFAFLIHCPFMGTEDTNTGWYSFEISEEAAIHPEPVYMRLHGLSAEPFNQSQMSTNLIHPDQQIVAVIHLVGLPGYVAERTGAGCEIVVFWDAMARASLTPGEPFQP
jgi:hypothetical protein